jgi:hypothetical protein
MIQRSTASALRAGLLLLAPLLLSGCALLKSSDPDAISNVESETAGHHLTLATEEFEAGDLDGAIDRLIALRALVLITPEERARADAMLQAAVRQLFDLYEEEGRGSSDFVRIYELDLPVHLRATAGLLAADRLIDEGHPVRSFKAVRRVDRKLPTHQARGLAAQVLSRTGHHMLERGGHYWFLFSYTARGVSALEYLVVQYPTSPLCAEAYVALAEHYEGEADLDRAIERHEDLLIYHPESPAAVLSQARLPYLRLQRLERDDYDRSQLVFADIELERWLARYSGNELEPWVRTVQEECRTRLTNNDLVLARYYARIDSPFGARMHAERALATAQASGLTDMSAEALALLDRYAVEAVSEGVEIVPAEELPAEELPAEQLR